MDNNTNQNNNSGDYSEIEGELKARFELLPKELQDTITSSDYQMKLFEIAKKYKLTYEKLGQLELETTMVLLGMTPPEEYEEDLSEQLGMKKEELSGLVKDVNDQVFLAIREQLKKIYTNTPDSTAPKAPETVVRAYDTVSTPVAREPQMQKGEADVFTNSGIEIVGQTPQVPQTPTPIITPKPTGPINLSDIKKTADSFQFGAFTKKPEPAPQPAPSNMNAQSGKLPLDIPMPTPPKPQAPSTPAPSIVSEGLNGVVANPNTTKDYSMPNMTPGINKGGDPYREQL
jgi:hypothetical protein